MTAQRDWNAIFAERKAARDRERARRLAAARDSAARTGKEPFDGERFRELYVRLRPDDVEAHAVWETLVREAEYDYYVQHPEIMTLEALIEHMKWLEGWG